MVANNANIPVQLELAKHSPSSFLRLTNWILDHGWYVYSSNHIHVAIPSSQTYKILETAAKPSVKRLGLRKLFANSRRYFIRARSNGGFQIMTTSRVWWYPRRRTNPRAILSAKFEQIDDSISRIQVSSRVKLRYLLGQFIWPTLISSIVISLNWSPIFVMLCVLALYSLSWSAHRATAMLEIYEITFFMETVLENFAPSTPEELSAADADVVIEDDFTTEWDRYVEEKLQH